ncbi:hypothetical protein NDU88_006816 [Pleurodeles waltl]|uniref:Secreted protein n=1 Tax=Pleurodeles waltl TaxID=8319 RepID=A0AAV7N0C8_PLEWA|nr:hypothetical protein NDU88_006816 [Pleurodeles waltl]
MGRPVCPWSPWALWAPLACPFDLPDSGEGLLAITTYASTRGYRPGGGEDLPCSDLRPTAETAGSDLLLSRSVVYWTRNCYVLNRANPQVWLSLTAVGPRRDSRRYLAALISCGAHLAHPRSCRVSRSGLQGQADQEV